MLDVFIGLKIVGQLVMKYNLILIKIF